MLKVLKRALAFVTLSFMGGFMAILFLSWRGRGIVPEIDQAISIANTYIVFTTFIFVAFTVLLTVVGYVLAQTFSSNAAAQHSDVVERVKDCIANDDEKATQVLKSLLSSPQVQRNLSKVIQNKVSEELQSRRADAQAMNDNSAAALKSLDDLLAPSYTDNGRMSPAQAARAGQQMRQDSANSHAQKFQFNRPGRRPGQDNDF